LTDADIITTEDLLKLARKTKSRLFKHPFARNEKSKNFLERVLRKINRKYLLDWTPFPGASGSFLLRKELFTKFKFRNPYERTRPSQKGRGKDRDLAFWLVESLKNSLALKVPLYLWRVKNQNSNYLDEKYRPTI